MPTIGAGVVEIRVREASGAFRLVYVAKFAEAIYVLHVFQKQSQRTAPLHVMLARQRYATLRRHRSKE